MTDDLQPGEMTASFDSKAPYTTWSLSLTYHLADENDFNEIAADMIRAGWQLEPHPASPLNGVQQQVFNKRGSGLFGTWEKNEESAFLTEARQLMRNYGFERIPKNKLTYAQLI
jgi:hypothetical protein